jgi:hypothetical protein
MQIPEPCRPGAELFAGKFCPITQHITSCTGAELLLVRTSASLQLTSAAYVHAI